MVTSSRLASLLGLGILAATLAGLNLSHPSVEIPVQPIDGVILGSSNLLQSIDCEQLSAETDGKTWWNLSQRGLVGVELFAVAEDLIEQHPPEILVFEVIGDPVGGFRSDWRKATCVSAADFISAMKHQQSTAYSKAVVFAEHLAMRATHGLHALIREESPRVVHPTGQISPSTRGWQVTGAADSTWLEQLRSAEIAARKAISGNTPSKNCQLVPSHLQQLQILCDSHGVQLIPVLQPASDCHGCIENIRKHFHNRLILLDGGLDPSPFSTPAMMSDPRHLNATGAALVTRQLATELSR